MIYILKSVPSLNALHLREPFFVRSKFDRTKKDSLNHDCLVKDVSFKSRFNSSDWLRHGLKVSSNSSSLSLVVFLAHAWQVVFHPVAWSNQSRQLRPEDENMVLEHCKPLDCSVPKPKRFCTEPQTNHRRDGEGHTHWTNKASDLLNVHHEHAPAKNNCWLSPLPAADHQCQGQQFCPPLNDKVFL